MDTAAWEAVTAGVTAATDKETTPVGVAAKVKVIKAAAGLGVRDYRTLMPIAGRAFCYYYYYYYYYYY